MKRLAAGACGVAVVGALVWAAVDALAAQAEGVVVNAAEKAPSAPAADPRRSGFDAMTAELRAMQQDDASNPGMLWVKDGEALWNRVDGAAGKSCASCHGVATTAMRGVAARYPAFDTVAARPFTLAQRIDACRVRHQQAEPLRAESDARLALEAFVAFQSRGQPIAPPGDPRLEPFRAEGERLYRQRIGQIDLACVQCHDEHAGQRLAGSTIPQAHPTGYPIYRLEWQSAGSLQRRLRGCMSGVRAEPYPYDSQELVALEIYLAKRAEGLKVETPAVRP
jgi:L-cysteine S-thiosulfotransferase